MDSGKGYFLESSGFKSLSDTHLNCNHESILISKYILKKRIILVGLLLLKSTVHKNCMEKNTLSLCVFLRHDISPCIF